MPLNLNRVSNRDQDELFTNLGECLFRLRMIDLNVSKRIVMVSQHLIAFNEL